MTVNATIELVFTGIITAAASVAAVAAVGIYRRVDELVGSVERHGRTLYGEADNPEWDGLVQRVAEHESKLTEDEEEE